MLCIREVILGLADAGRVAATRPRQPVRGKIVFVVLLLHGESFKSLRGEGHPRDLSDNKNSGLSRSWKRKQGLFLPVPPFCKFYIVPV